MLILFATLVAAIPNAKAYDYDYGYASNLYTTNWLQYQDNAANTSLALSQIAELFGEPIHYEWHGWWGWVPMGYTYGEVINWGSSTTENIVLSRIDHDITYHSCFSTVLYIGHGTAEGFCGHSDDPNDPYNPPDLVYYDDNGDNDIRSHTSSSPAHHFVFMWVCTGSNPFPDGSITAWNPLWWSHPPAYGEYTWVGFENASPWLIEWMGTYGDYGKPNIYKYWLVWFYYYALHPNVYSVMEALNLASQSTGFSDYGSSILGVGYDTYWPYPPQGPDNFTGRMYVAGDPYGTFLPTDEYVYP